jgi:ParB/RepB/Spo0J family partition protein
MTTMLLDPSQIVNNPYQTRLTEDAEHIAALAESIREVGLLQTPLARLTPEGNVAVLAFGHSRLAAWKIAKPGEAFPLEIRALSDRQMSDLAAEENSRRKNLTAIETARAIQRRIDDFGLTQLEAGKPFGYQSQGAVSNLLRLLKLPEPVQASVAAGELPERLARELLPLMQFDPTQVEKIAAKAVKAPEDERENCVSDGVDAIYRKLPNLDGWWHRARGGWDLAWPAKPVEVPGFNRSKGEPAHVPACKGCEFAQVTSRNLYCLRPACHALKTRLYGEHQVAAAVKRLGIPLAAKGEKVTVIYDGDYQTREQQRAEKLIRAKLPELRLVPNPRIDHGSNYLKQVLGSPFVVLATTSKAAAEKYLDDSRGKSVSAAVVPGESDAQRKARLAREEKEQDKRRAERIEVNRNRADLLWLMESCAQHIAERTFGGGGLVRWAARMADNVHNTGNYVSEVNELLETWRKKADVRSGTIIENYGLGNASDEVDAARRAFIALVVMRKELCGYKTPGQFFSDPKPVRTGIKKLARDEFNVTLPDGWDQFPVHQTSHNCWNCGRFAGNSKGITKAEKSEGWLVAEKTGTVTCPNCHDAIPTLPAPAPNGNGHKPGLGGVDEAVLREIIGTEANHAEHWVKKADVVTLREAARRQPETGHNGIVGIAIRRRIKQLEKSASVTPGVSTGKKTKRAKAASRA